MGFVSPLTQYMTSHPPLSTTKTPESVKSRSEHDSSEHPTNGIRTCTSENRCYYNKSVNVHDVDSPHILELAANPPDVDT